jgi:ribonuclease HI
MAPVGRRNSVEIWTDGASSGKKVGAGGHAAILLFADRDQLIRGGDASTTNQRMELLAPITALESLTDRHDVVLYTDSAYVGDCFILGWWERWLTNGWRNSKGQAVANQDLWERLLVQNRFHRIDWRRVDGHDERYPLNQLCDFLAVAEKRRYLKAASAVGNRAA